jgi:hypothetical protein
MYIYTPESEELTALVKAVMSKKAAMVRIFLCNNMCIFIHIYRYICIYMCIYVYNYIYVYIYIYIYIIYVW